MARRRGPKRYKIVTAQTKDMGSAGAQQLLAKITSVDPENVVAFVNNVRIGVIQNDGDGDNGGFILYATTSDTWADSDITAFGATGSLGGTVNLSLKRRVRDGNADGSRTDGPIYIWAEVTDLGTVQNTARFIHETWGWGHKIELL